MLIKPFAVDDCFFSALEQNNKLQIDLAIKTLLLRTANLSQYDLCCLNFITQLPVYFFILRMKQASLVFPESHNVVLLY